MQKTFKTLLAVMVITLATVGAVGQGYAADNANTTADKTLVRITTNLGDIDIELDTSKAPITTRNFINHVKKGTYDGLIFHRVIKGFMVQAGGFRPGMRKIETGKTIQNEADNGLKNARGTIAMARTSDPHSASAQFFINTVDNRSLDYSGKTLRSWGYAVFGKVTRGMEVVDKMESSKTGRVGDYGDVPVNDIVISKVVLLTKNTKK